MTVNALDHVNIVVEDLDAAARFYAELLSLVRGNAPSPGKPDEAQWMFDSGGRPIIHLNAVECPRRFDRDLSPGPTGPIHHVALNCSGHSEMMRRIADLGLPHQSNHVASIGLKQIFVHDPHGVLLELNFRED